MSQIQLKNVGQTFVSEGVPVTLFESLDLTIEQGQAYAITGPSGAGKSSLLMLLAGLEQPTCGEIFYQKNAKQFDLSTMRDQVGFIFQQFHLLPELTALNNVALPLKLRGEKNATKQAEKWLTRVGLAHRLHHKPAELSGGEQQRVAIARALIFNPSFIFADEPTGNLDQHNAQHIAELLLTCCRENGAGLVIVTHSDELAHQADHVFTLNHGQCLPKHNEGERTSIDDLRGQAC